MTKNKLVILHAHVLLENYFLVFKCLQTNFIYLLSGQLTLNSPFGRYILNMGGVCFQLVITALFIQLSMCHPKSVYSQCAAFNI